MGSVANKHWNNLEYSGWLNKKENIYDHIYQFFKCMCRIATIGVLLAVSIVIIFFITTYCNTLICIIWENMKLIFWFTEKLNYQNIKKYYKILSFQYSHQSLPWFRNSVYCCQIKIPIKIENIEMSIIFSFFCDLFWYSYFIT